MYLLQYNASNCVSLHSTTYTKTLLLFLHCSIVSGCCLLVCTGMDALKTIYQSILSQHMTINSFPPQVQKMSEKLVVAALQLHQTIASSFLPTAIKFHYIFNLRDLSNIFQGILFSTSECAKTPVDFLRLWLHEASRVYGDKLIDKSDMTTLVVHKHRIANASFDVRNGMQW